MWISIDKEQADALLAIVSEDPTVKYLQERVRHYRSLESPVEDRFRAAAKENHHCDGELEIDDGAVVSCGSDPGAYVQAWIWITNEEAGFDSEAGSEELEEEVTV